MLSRTCTIAATLLVMALGASGALAQSASPTQFTLNQLERQPGTVMISPGYITIIEFPDAATRATSGNPALIKVQPRKGSNVVEMTAAKLSGQTDLVVTTGGKIVMFVIKIDPQGKAPRRYTVTGPSAVVKPAASSAPAPVAATPASPTQASPAPASPTLRPSAAPLERYEAERAVIYRADLINSGQASGGRRVEHINDALSRVTFPAVRAPRTGRYILRVYYTNGEPLGASQTLMVNGISVPEVRYASTGNWDRIASVDIAVNLRGGLNVLRFGRGQGVATLDALDLLGVGSAAQSVTPAAAQSAVPARSAQRLSIPVPNSGFEADLTSWFNWQDPEKLTPQTIGNKQAHGGDKYLVLSSKSALRQNTLQTISGLSDGIYSLEMWVRTSGGQDALALFALDYGGKELNLALPTNENATWVKYTLPGIAVTNGQVKIGIWSRTPAGNIWAHIDDVALYREAEQP